MGRGFWSARCSEIGPGSNLPAQIGSEWRVNCWSPEAGECVEAVGEGASHGAYVHMYTLRLIQQGRKQPCHGSMLVTPFTFSSFLCLFLSLLLLFFPYIFWTFSLFDRQIGYP